jgi:anti-sigma factor RsiW
MASLSPEERANLVAFLDGELDEETSQTLEAKLNLDPQARAEAEALRQAWGLLDYLPKAEPSPTFTNRTMERLSLARASSTQLMPRRKLRRLPWPAAVSWAAAILIAAGGGLAVGSYLGSDMSETAGPDAPMIQHLRIAEKWRYYENAEDLDFLRQLAQPDLFGDDTGT